jgi:hypothetical protein
MNSSSPIRIKFEALSESLHQQLSRLKANPNPSLLETDLAKETLREIYSVIDQLAEAHHDLSAISEAAIVRPEPVADIIVPEVPVRQVELVESENAINISEVPPPAIVAEVRVTTEVQDSIQPELSPAEIAPVVNYQAKPDLQETRKTVYAETIAKSAQAGQQTTIGSRYSAEESLSDRITQSGQPTRLSDQLQRKPLEDLRVSIGLNERFAFINALFGGNQQSFYAAVDKLNAAASFPDATSELNNLHATYGWEPNHAQVIELTELVKRRFGI